ncbi:NAD(P)H-dependent oxidoreductase [Acidipila sp. EB88]|uniref:NAD(P)H-dependent oxidoreductase n=1 Tax=Acidipila sp. EB88 TaxID=2305226 RepID=UPI000F5E7CF0|nr:NAD(P)H-dependent oxidoreductase [Acidipila sp. EB88]RRA49857.1 NAD(P)H-dependent oxidoreductase [Acidipila sp. EB88]
MSLIPALKKRYAVKKYNPAAKISSAQLDILLEALRLAPTSFNLQPFHLLQVTEPAVREHIRTEAAFNQPQVTEASLFFVLAAETDVDEQTIAHSIDLAAEVRGVARSTLEGRESQIKGFIMSLAPEQRLIWAQRQAYIALGVLVSAAAEAGIDVSPMEGFVPNKVDAILGLQTKRLRSTVLVAVGVHSNDDEHAHLPKVRKSIEQIHQTI